MEKVAREDTMEHYYARILSHLPSRKHNWIGNGAVAGSLVSTAVVNEILTEENYEKWRISMRNYLQARNILNIVEDEVKYASPRNASSESSDNLKPEEVIYKFANPFAPEKDGVGFQNWRRENDMALYAIQKSCGADLLAQIKDILSAKSAWDFLAKNYGKQSHEASNLPVSTDRNYDEYAGLLKAVKDGALREVKDILNGNGEVEDGELREVKDIINGDREVKKNGDNKAVLGEVITYRGKTALHVAVTAGHVEIVKELVKQMSPEQLKIQDASGCTAFCVAASMGIKEMVKCMHEKSKDLIRIPYGRLLPVVLAASECHEDVVNYLYRVTPKDELTGDKNANGAALISNCIAGRMFDVALDLLLRLKVEPNFVRDLEMLSLMPSIFRSWKRPVFCKRVIYSCFRVQLTCEEIEETKQDKTCGVNLFKQVFGRLHGLLSNLLKLSGFKYIYDQKLMNVQADELICCIGKQIQSLSKVTEFQRGLVYNAIFRAVRHGIVEFTTELIKVDPELLLRCTDENDRDIFMNAVLYRQENIFSEIHKIKAGRNVNKYKDVDSLGNNMLHLAGIVQPFTQLDRIPGPALQMQRELQWFKKVKSIVHPECKESVNNDGETPRNLFKKNHKDYVKEGQQWMTRTATSCSLVAALMVTITFAVAFTVPGGEDNETGLPIFYKKTLFTVFIICDATSLFFSTASAMIFLGILTSRYTEKDFLKSLPKKMFFGQITLFVSIVTMMITFSTALFLMLKGQPSWIYLLIISFASIPIVQFVMSQYTLLHEIFISSFGSGIFDKKP